MKKLREKNYIDAAKSLNVEVAVIKAVAQVESLSNGFFSNGEPVILFERHKFDQFTKGIFSKEYPSISNPKAGGYSKGLEEHNRLRFAVSLNREAALKSTSWGKFQIMGFNFKLAGFQTLQEFINAMYKDEASQLNAFVNFVKSAHLTDDLQKKDWPAFAKGYNGAAYHKNSYDVKLSNAYQQFSK